MTLSSTSAGHVQGLEIIAGKHAFELNHEPQEDVWLAALTAECVFM